MATKLAEAALEVAKESLGKKEATGHNDGAFVLMLQRFVAAGARWLDGQPWCACFVSWCVAQAGKRIGLTPILPPKGSSSDIFAAAERFNLVISGVPNKFQLPCIGLLRNYSPTSAKTHDHAFIVLGVDDDLVVSIDGNWKNAVSRAIHPTVICDFIRIA